MEISPESRRRDFAAALEEASSSGCETPAPARGSSPSSNAMSCGERERGAFLAGQKSSHYLHRAQRTDDDGRVSVVIPTPVRSGPTFGLFLSFLTTDYSSEDDTRRRVGHIHCGTLPLGSLPSTPIISKSPLRDKILFLLAFGHAAEVAT